MVTLIGRATNTEARADELLSFISAQSDRLTADLADTADPKVYLAGNSGMLSTAGDAMFQSDMIRLAGGENVAAEITDTYWVETSYEQILTWNPEYIILASDAAYTAEDVLNDANLADCDAVKNGNVYQMPAKAEAWDSPVPSGILGSVWLASVLHPDICTEAEAAEIIDSYSDVTVSADSEDPSVCLVEFSFAVAHGLNRIYLTAHITV
jgi:iron complex transport system substrate-binding protein